jgi:hypothetical protein
MTTAVRISLKIFLKKKELVPPKLDEKGPRKMREASQLRMGGMTLRRLRRK